MGSFKSFAVGLTALIIFVCHTPSQSQPPAISTNGARPAGQQSTKPQDDDVLRINTDLIQTAITVVDKDGRFVDGLQPGQFELSVDGKPRTISFFERVTAGSSRESQLLARSAGVAAPISPPEIKPSVRGRTIIFFVDDLHLSPDSLHRTRDALRHFLGAEMNSRDSVVIASASGQIGFLQQFTNNKEVLEAAIDRLAPIPYEARGYGTGSTKMNEFMALNIETTKSNERMLSYYIQECVRQSSIPKRIPSAIQAILASCETQVRNSARGVLLQAGEITGNTYRSLESLLASSSRSPGRKLAFFLSDGFLLDYGPHGPNLREKLEHLIDTARRQGVVFYTIDTRGLSPDMVDVRVGNAPLDVGAPVGETEAYQDALNALAGDTGGRALRNQNYFDRWVEKVLDETSNYYLVAWRPAQDEDKLQKFRHVRLTIAGHPELTVRAPRGYVDGPRPITAAAAEKPAPKSGVKSSEAELTAALGDFLPSTTLPTILSLTYLNTPTNETVLTSSIEISNRGMTFGPEGKQPATIKLAGVILTDKKKVAASFSNQLTVNPLKSDHADSTAIIYNHHSPLSPGIYQVRVAARDEKSGHVGSAMQWVVIPDLTSHKLTLSSVLLGGQVLDANRKDGSAQIQLSVSHRFARNSRMAYWIFVYNASRDAAGVASLSAHAEVLRDRQVVLSSPQRKLNQAGFDPNRIPFADELALQTLPPGDYDLRVTIVDNLTGNTTSQTVDFHVW